MFLITEIYIICYIFYNGVVTIRLRKKGVISKWYILFYILGVILFGINVFMAKSILNKVLNGCTCLAILITPIIYISKSKIAARNRLACSEIKKG
ncbi:hypothetical protein Ccel_3151 [Ruminiclostridium cellulolyticum H10]|uniref:Uncharacterized protein n=1 Tax=Ruminiclostridium cellulolyticum (strain ATCC 35319 / DSM 5812 / JCM 6584 / H10) TaxID=394503 RepID=B8I0B6_RUMCH|nr:hypothetical protein Ccel_3151 [Ruminiclostridium cellulolyticum H10]